MRTLGIDLASRDENTAVCAVEWQASRAVIVKIERPCADKTLLAEIAAAERVGIAAPFGWPDAFVQTLGAHHRGEPWPPNTDHRTPCVRLTDRVVGEIIGRPPLSIASDKLAVPAVRCAFLLGNAARAPGHAGGAGPFDRTGNGRAAEVLPAAALKRWSVEPRKDKRTAGPVARRAIVEHLARECRGLELDDATRESLAKSDPVTDAFIAALVARAVAIGATTLPSAEQLEVARREGWIHVPAPGSLARLVHAS